MPDVTPDPKSRTITAPVKRRYRRKVAGPKRWAAMRDDKLADATCRLCPQPAGSLHHLVPRRSPFFGDDVLPNLVPLCNDCHLTVEDGYNDATARLAAALEDDEYAHVIGKLGEDALPRLFGVARA